jgi:spore coat polysaccharide biosynthesis protein SpsF (cytidylyltransferase family)
MHDIAGKPMIWHILERCKKVKTGQTVILATSDDEKDDDLVPVAEESGIYCFRGNDSDVLDRYFNCATEFNIDPIVRITGDCPLVDMETANKVILKYLRSKFDYIRTGLSYPDGLNVEVFSLQSLEKASDEAILSSEREHVTPYIWKNPSLFKIEQVELHPNLSNFRLTVDYEEDLVFINRIFDKLYKKDNFFGFKQVYDLLRSDPELMKSMPKPRRYEGYKLSLSQDKVQ